jgi:alpha/beta superfamily hydrolase
MTKGKAIPMRSEKFEFPNAKGEKLAGMLDLPLGEPAAYVLFAHCFTCGKDSRAAKRIAERLAENGIAVLRFDFTGPGGSESEFANTHFSSSVEDLVAAADHQRHPIPRMSSACSRTRSAPSARKARSR